MCHPAPTIIHGSGCFCSDVYKRQVVRKLSFEGRNKEAQRLIDANFLTQQHGMSYLTLGSLYLEFPEHQNGSGFYRELNLENATTTTRYQVDDVTYRCV